MPADDPLIETIVETLGGNESDDSIGRARAALAYLAGRGLLFPEGGETREERGYWNPDTREVQHWWSYSEHGYKAPDRRRTVTEWPDGRAYFAPWEAVDDHA